MLVGVPVALGAETGTPSDVITRGVINGPGTCATSGCHGGASEMGRQFVIWSQRDVHTRSYATLTSARSARMAEALKISDPTKSATCTACHAPLQTVEPAMLASDAHVEDGVACATCHGVASEDWLRRHTRPDWTHADRVAAGMRDLRNLYGRANNCVACHQNIDPQIVKVAHHPQLIFELDGQAASEPKHWREIAGWQGAQAWYVGQNVALREMSWALANAHADPALDAPRWAGLLWVLQHSVGDDSIPSVKGVAADTTSASFAAAMDAADQSAKRAAEITWSTDTTRSVLKNLAASHPAFLDATVAKDVQAYRAERLVLALDRVTASLPANQRPAAAGAPLDKLFQLAQSIPDFAPAEFAKALATFEQALN